MVPEAQIAHRAGSRLRLRIPARRGDGEYFFKLEEYLLRYRPFRALETNPVTGSVLVVDDGLDVGDLAQKAEADGFFAIRKPGRPPIPLSGRMVQPLGSLSDSVRRMSGGEVDLPGLIFMGLLGTGIYQIVRGNFGAPPWYTAFWYAFGVFTKSLIDKGGRGNDAAT
jgi:hypothetical protein